ncbi:high-affinity iron transporter [Ferrithrix thermotolerans DSM 19514]|uniref:High-affinity iron transporter n=1 Tax=Ferrithrix thermotolerans DSM 19514 TaxID=1121881 RepID=A0A1M4UUW6_9ACTN|nr:FTR1 family protein [Ferrithrix thermotolerans]SHE60469.1 high-affinity iron transporter [Ferrithrix thermotolerans DSM 19514]
MLATFAIFLREGIEASIIVSVLMAYLKKTNQSDGARAVKLGVVAALVTAALAGTVIYETVHSYAGTRMQTVIETASYAIAVIFLTYMTFWMTKHSKDIPKALTAKVAEAQSKGGGNVALFIVAFQAIARESLEAMVFTLAIVLANGTGGPAVGAALGVIGTIFFAVLVYRFGKRVNLAVAFRALGAALLVFSAALIVDMIENLQSLGWIKVLSTPLWNSSSLLNESSNIGDIAHTLLGYAAQPTPLEIIAYVTYLVIGVSVFNHLTKAKSRKVVSS